MLTLSLFRHAKSSWDDAALADHDRPLGPRGRRDAPRMGAYMAAHRLVPDIVLCSTALRTRQTVELTVPELPKPRPEVQIVDSLYLASAAGLMKHVRAIEPQVSHAMIVGHNPGLHGLATRLAGAGDSEALAALAAKFPTGALAVLDFDVAGWAQVTIRSGRLRDFMVPKRLP
jgi:phosphohistidine phosphatase